MNTLSWLIYLAGVADGISVLCVISLIMCGLAALSAGLTWLVNVDYCGDEDIADQAKKFLFKIPRAAIPIGLVCAFIPSSNTIYAIAASEMGERALKSETGGKAVQALNAWLDRQIAGEPKEKK